MRIGPIPPLVVLLLTIGCGGGTDGAPPPSLPVPPVEQAPPPEPEDEGEDEFGPLEACLQHCILAEEQCVWEGDDKSLACDLECENLETDAAYDKCLGSCSYKAKMLVVGCGDDRKKCEDKCHLGCGDYDCK